MAGVVTPNKGLKKDDLVGYVASVERATGQAGLVDGLFPSASRTRHDADLLPDLLPGSAASTRWCAIPRFQLLKAHLHSAIACLADGGRLSAIVAARLFENREAMAALACKGRVVGRGEPWAELPAIAAPEDLPALARARAEPDGRPNARLRAFRQVCNAARLQPRAREAATGSSRLASLSSTAPVTYAARPWSGEGREVGLYAAYAESRLVLDGVAEHPSPLVESAAMATTPPPAPT